MGSEMYENRWMLYLGNKDDQGTLGVIRDSSFDDVPIVCKDGYSKRIKYLAKNDRSIIPGPIEARDAAKYIKNNGINAVYIDDVRGVLEDLLGCRVNGASIGLYASKNAYGDDEYGMLSLCEDTIEFTKNDSAE